MQDEIENFFTGVLFRCRYHGVEVADIATHCLSVIDYIGDLDPDEVAETIEMGRKIRALDDDE